METKQRLSGTYLGKSWVIWKWKRVKIISQRMVSFGDNKRKINNESEGDLCEIDCFVRIRMWSVTLSPLSIPPLYFVLTKTKQGVWWVRPNWWGRYAEGWDSNINTVTSPPNSSSCSDTSERTGKTSGHKLLQNPTKNTFTSQLYH